MPFSQDISSGGAREFGHQRSGIACERRSPAPTTAMLLHTPGRWLHHRPKLGRRLLTSLSSFVFPSSPLSVPPTALAVGAFRPWILLSHAPLGAPLPCKRTNGTGYYGCCKRGDTTRKGQSALRSGTSSLAFFNLKPSFHGRDDVLSLSMTWNVHHRCGEFPPFADHFPNGKPWLISTYIFVYSRVFH